MIIRCWGARGSIPVSGAEYLSYGGDTTCLEIRTKNDDVIIVDAGTGIRQLGNRLKRENHSDFHMVFTHAHWDHLIGFPFFKPLFSKHSHIAIYGDPVPGHSMKDILTKLMRAPTFPVDYGVVAPRIHFEKDGVADFAIDSVTVTPVALSHPGGGRGYVFREDGKSFVFLTDNELGYVHPGGLERESYRDICSGVDLLIHDAEFTPEEYEHTRHWGHSSYTDALDLALKAGVGRFGLFHHNKERTDEALDSIVEECRNIIQRERSTLDCFALTQNSEIIL